MTEAFDLLLDESIQIELNAAELYRIFHTVFPEDADFWWKLHLEEKNHAALIRAGKEDFLPIGKFPLDMVTQSLEAVKRANSMLAALISEYQDTPPSRQDAFNAALLLEESAAELHFQKFMSKEAESKIDEIFQQLNMDDRNHAKRIRSYMEDHGMECTP
jgi:hypothetical protein